MRGQILIHALSKSRSSISGPPQHGHVRRCGMAARMRALIASMSGCSSPAATLMIVSRNGNSIGVIPSPIVTWEGEGAP